jgi:dolichol phosphate-mannose biosynthesis regulatory protein
MSMPLSTQPFVDDKHSLQAYFPPRKYAIAIPAVLLVIFIAAGALFVGITLVNASRQKRKKA